MEIREENLCAMLREAAATDSNLLGEKIIATSTTRSVMKRVVRRREERFMKLMLRTRKMGREKGDEAGDVHFMHEVCRVI